MSVETVRDTRNETSIAPDAFDFFQKYVYDKIGVQLEGKAYLAESRLQPLVRDHGLADINELIEKIRRGDRVIAAAAVESMTTNETSFFRDVHPFEALADTVLPDSFSRSRKVRIWNGACSSGQESYSLAMILHEKLPAKANARSVEILSTDVSQEMVKRTTEGVYSRFEVNRGLPADLAQKYFDQRGRQYEAKPILKELITVAELNLLGRWPTVGKCDVVVLRNVLIYFSADTKHDILRRIRTEVLQPGGCLILGASESTIGIDNGYEAKKVGRTTFYVPGGAR